MGLEESEDGTEVIIFGRGVGLGGGGYTIWAIIIFDAAAVEASLSIDGEPASGFGGMDTSEGLRVLFGGATITDPLEGFDLNFHGVYFTNLLGNRGYFRGNLGSNQNRPFRIHRCRLFPGIL